MLVARLHFGVKSFPGTLALLTPSKGKKTAFPAAEPCQPSPCRGALGTQVRPEQCSRVATRGRAAPTKPQQASRSGLKEGGLVLGHLPGQEALKSVGRSCPWAGDSLSHGDVRVGRGLEKGSLYRCEEPREQKAPAVVAWQGRAEEDWSLATHILEQTHLVLPSRPPRRARPRYQGPRQNGIVGKGPPHPQHPCFPGG